MILLILKTSVVMMKKRKLISKLNKNKQNTSKLSRNTSNSKMKEDQSLRNKSNLSFKKSESSIQSVDEENKVFIDQKKQEFQAIVTYLSENSKIKTMTQLKTYLYSAIEEKHLRFKQINNDVQNFHILLKQK